MLGVLLGLLLGFSDGALLGSIVGEAVGSDDGWSVDALFGSADGAQTAVHWSLFTRLHCVGSGVGWREIKALGSADGAQLGDKDGGLRDHWRVEVGDRFG